MKIGFLKEGGRLSLGFICGSLAMLFTLLFLDFFELLPFTDSGFTGTIIGAMIAGSIGLSGQLIILLQSSHQSEEKTKLEERALLESLFSKLVQNLSVFRSVKSHLVSEEEADNIYFGGLPTLSKPIKIGHPLEQFTTAELALPIRLANSGLFNLLNVSSSNANLFTQAHSIYDQKMQTFVSNIQQSNNTRFESGSVSGNVEINPADHYELTDIQKHYWDATFSGLLLTFSVLQLVKKLLETRHSTSINFKSGVSEDDILMLVNSVDLGDFRDDVLASLES